METGTGPVSCHWQCKQLDLSPFCVLPNPVTPRLLRAVWRSVIDILPDRLAPFNNKVARRGGTTKYR